jgi:F-type H+-transporting ATPase subunit b
MPQLDISTYASQLFWLCICFFTMLFIMSKLIIPRLDDIMKKRHERIDGTLAKAEKAHDKAEAAIKRYEEALEQATQKAGKSLEKAQKELKELIDRKSNDVSLRMASKVAESEAEIDKNRQKALKEVRGIAETIAFEVVQKIGINEVSKKDIAEALTKVAK